MSACPAEEEYRPTSSSAMMSPKMAFYFRNKDHRSSICLGCFKRAQRQNDIFHRVNPSQFGKILPRRAGRRSPAFVRGRTAVASLRLLAASFPAHISVFNSGLISV